MERSGHQEAAKRKLPVEQESGGPEITMGLVVRLLKEDAFALAQES